MSAKPVHLGHWMMIQQASKENDKVFLFVSLTNRARKGEITILGSDMDVIWHDIIEKYLPGNVTLVTEGNPMQKMYDMLIDAEESGSRDVFRLYAGKKDIETRFSPQVLRRKLPELMKRHQLIPVAAKIVTSGTQMREYLADNDKKDFIANLPPVSKADAERIWGILRSSIQAEGSLRDYIALIM